MLIWRRIPTMRRNADFTWEIVLALLITGIGTLWNERLCILATGPSRQSAKAKSKNGTATANGRLNNEQTSYQGMIRSFQGTIRSYHGMIRPFQDTNDLFRLNASYNVIIFDWFSFSLRSVFVRSSFILRSSFVHPSFILRSGFVRDSFGIRRTIKEATKKLRKCIWGTTEAQQRMNEAKTMPKRSLNRRSPFAFQNDRFASQKDSFYSPKRLLLDTKRTTFGIRSFEFWILN